MIAIRLRPAGWVPTLYGRAYLARVLPTIRPAFVSRMTGTEHFCALRERAGGTTRRCGVSLPRARRLKHVDVFCEHVHVEEDELCERLLVFLRTLVDARLTVRGHVEQAREQRSVLGAYVRAYVFD